MTVRATHTSAILALSKAAHDEIVEKLREAGHDHAIADDGTVDMHGIAVAPERQLKVKLTYFKPSGKFYTEGEYMTTRTGNMYDIFGEVREMRDAGKLPGLAEGSRAYHILVEAPDHPRAFPGLIPEGT